MTRHLLLEELRVLGVVITTDGAQLFVDTPKGVMTPDLWEKLSTQKQEIITHLCSSTLDTDEDERLHTFASAISHMVDVLGGPGSVSITRHDPNLTLEQYTRQIRPPYQPVTLPELPRSACPHRSMVVKHQKDGDHQVEAACQGKPLEHGWCGDHAHSHDFLCLGALLGYPEVAGPHRAIGEGVANWEAYAERATPVHLERDMTSIRTRFRVASP